MDRCYPFEQFNLCLALEQIEAFFAYLSEFHFLF